MGDFGVKLLLAVIAFLLGLLADIIKRLFQRERRRVAYSIEAFPIIAMSAELPEVVRGKLQHVEDYNVMRFKILAENTGSVFIKNVNVVIVPSLSSEIIDVAVTTNPPILVKYAMPQLSDNRLTCTGIELEKKQTITLDVYVRAEAHPGLEAFWSGGGGDVLWDRELKAGAFTVEQNVRAIIRYYIFAQLPELLLTGIGIILYALFPALRNQTNWQLSGIGVGSVLASLVRFYFYLRIIPHAVALLRYLVESRHQSVTRGLTSARDCQNGVCLPGALSRA
jgi:hypothetical protein